MKLEVHSIAKYRTNVFFSHIFPTLQQISSSHPKNIWNTSWMRKQSFLALIRETCPKFLQISSRAHFAKKTTFLRHCNGSESPRVSRPKRTGNPFSGVLFVLASHFGLGKSTGGNTNDTQLASILASSTGLKRIQTPSQFIQGFRRR